MHNKIEIGSSFENECIEETNKSLKRSKTTSSTPSCMELLEVIEIKCGSKLERMTDFAVFRSEELTELFHKFPAAFLEELSSLTLWK